MLIIPMSTPIDQICSNLAARIDVSRDYTVITHDNIYRAGFSDSYLFSSTYQRGLSIKQELLEAYLNVSFDDALNGEVIEMPDGRSCYQVTDSVDCRLDRPDPDLLRTLLWEDLTLIPGIGARTAASLQRRGYRTINDLIWNRRFREEASRVQRRIEMTDRNDLLDLVLSRHSRSHRLAFLAGSPLQKSDLLFFDIETLGFFSRPIILFGLARLRENQLITTQFLLKGVRDEQAALMATLKLFSPGTVLITFNGRSFDLPYLQERCAYYRLPEPRLPQIDLLHHSRSLWKNQFQDCKLGTLEAKLCGTVREDDLPSAMVPEFYAAYQQTGNPGPLVPIVEHNRQDLVTTAHLYGLIQEIYHDR
ncbi:ribonuclease H-like domain-containing protein [Methanosphaerula palustris]|uniref:YprB ribonuclease H-like domain-containing protein n=1 Tax=Methanosphaerula palustris (strain ATCC BAA-1556 / DSM 19958 / E1-9c) TaxID=521011 RepID=B8GE44_METPE|nr:ribonuclease H-like domain-containing protein [Methanosphaerula palustris]ACL17545.1 conserved hypothetical protein [Methanosphaerula palustris E1-9c]